MGGESVGGYLTPGYDVGLLSLLPGAPSLGLGTVFYTASLPLTQPCPSGGFIILRGSYIAFSSLPHTLKILCPLFLNY